ncbi:hypothetical protein BHE74_00005075 [Ensete ventricosum]|nr:hypothetical protein GW17_00034777 [Ensete ventricosum]RWW86164.1 hypothetical protein BHE74_00005075 [Ensete ventricosum]RZR89907.1 hypothetical protein BHM03_00017705 [Ensete ventricosum]
MRLLASLGGHDDALSCFPALGRRKVTSEAVARGAAKASCGGDKTGARSLRERSQLGWSVWELKSGIGSESVETPEHQASKLHTEINCLKLDLEESEQPHWELQEETYGLQRHLSDSQCQLKELQG